MIGLKNACSSYVRKCKLIKARLNWFNMRSNAIFLAFIVVKTPQGYLKSF
jgi:hypothetical protein